MSKAHYANKIMPHKTVILFESAQEAWFWYVRSERARRSGGRTFREQSMVTRPCDPDDLYRFVLRLRNKHILNDQHLKVLARFGWRESPPDKRVPQESAYVKIWCDAFHHLAPILLEKGIIRDAKITY